MNVLSYFNKNGFIVLSLLSLLGGKVTLVNATEGLYPYSKIEAVGFNELTIDDSFWNPWLETVQDISLPLLFDMAEKQGKTDNFRIVAGKKQGKIKLYNAPDSDVYKLLEAAGYSIYFRENKSLMALCDSVIDAIVAAQDPSGYINTQYTLGYDHPASPHRDNEHVKKFGYGIEDRWNSLAVDWPKGYSQLYCAGHLMEAAVAYYQGTGKRKLLDAAIRFANHICDVFDKEKISHYGEHPQIEIGLMKLYEVAGDTRYLDLADLMCRYVKFSRPVDIHPETNSAPLHEQCEAYGHCVRTAYIYTGATQVVRAKSGKDLREAVVQLWQNVTGKKMYIHGGTGNGTPAEQHGANYDLPIQPTYSECCASIAQGQWNHQLNLLTSEAKYANLVELEMYNSALSGISLDGKRFSYSNKLSAGTEERKNPHTGVRETYLFCCPSKLPGFVSGIGRWIYGKDATGIYINQYVGGSVTTSVSGHPVALRIKSDYVNKGKVMLQVESKGHFSIRFRIPQWLNQKELITGSPYFYDSDKGVATIRINGKVVRKPAIKDGYLSVTNNWTGKETIELSFDMRVRRVYTNSTVAANSGRVALMYGPLFYCLEGIDNSFDVQKMVLPAVCSVTSSYDKGLMGGMTVLTGEGLVGGKPVCFKAVPYFSWENRGIASMTVLLIESPEKTCEENVEEEQEMNTNG